MLMMDSLAMAASQNITSRQILLPPNCPCFLNSSQSSLVREVLERRNRRSTPPMRFEKNYGNMEAVSKDLMACDVFRQSHCSSQL